MRRVLVTSVVLFIAACGGGVRNEAKREAAQRNDIPTDRESALLIESLTKTFGSDAVDTCLAAWQAARDVHEDREGPVSKPGAGFRVFLSRCVGAPVPADLRMERPIDLRAAPVGANGVLTHESTHHGDELRMDRAISSDARANRTANSAVTGSDIPVTRSIDKGTP